MLEQIYKSSALLLLTLVFGAYLVDPAQSQENNVSLFLPIIMNVESDPSDILPLPDPLPIPEVFKNSFPVNFDAAAKSLQEKGLVLAHNKIGFHVGHGGYLEGISNYFKQLDSAGVPIVIKGVDGGGVVYEVQELAKASGVPHVMVFRRTGGSYELPDYNNDPIKEAKIHYDRLVDAWPQELDPSMVWMETVNEPDKNRSEWLAEYSLATAKLAVADGRRYAAFSWSAGEPEPFHWEGEAMLEFLHYAAEHKDLVAVALHEYSYETESISRIYPYLVGRFQLLFEMVDKHGIDRPTILITEWGWEYQNVPEVNAALEDIEWASRLYAAYPEVKGAAIWYLGGGYGGITYATHDLMEPLGDYSVSNYFGVTPGLGQIDPSLFYELEQATRQPNTAELLDMVIAEAKVQRQRLEMPR